MNDPAPPAKVVKRDGRVVDFDADRISQSLFAATESLARPDAFLARELADGVVHFLAQESTGETISTDQIAEVVVKVVRELGQVPLAAAFETCGRERERQAAKRTPEDPTESELSLRYPRGTSLSAFLGECARRYTLQNIYTRDLAAAQEAGLLTLTGLETPDELASCVLGPPSPGNHDLSAALEEARRFIGRQVAIDGLEHRAAMTGESAGSLARALVLALRRTGLEGVVNLACEPPSWAGPLARGPMFALEAADPARLRALADELREELLRLASPAVRIDWHLSEASFTLQEQPRLARVATDALVGGGISFVFDRSRLPLALAEGLTRKHPATLLAVGLNLPELASQPGMLADRDRFCQRLGSLVRLALSAAVQKRRFLHERERSRGGTGPVLTSGFLLDRARFVVTPVGLDEVVHRFTNWGMSNGAEALDLGKRIVLRLREVLRRDARAAQMDACLDGPASFGWNALPEGREAVAGLTPWDSAATVRSQLRAGGVLHGLAEQGTLALRVPGAEAVAPEQVVEWLRSAWRQTDVVRLRLLRS
jgi:hypothetical protein